MCTYKVLTYLKLNDRQKSICKLIATILQNMMIDTASLSHITASHKALPVPSEKMDKTSCRHFYEAVLSALISN